MRAVVQRSGRASVDVGGERVGEISKGLVVLLGVGHGDGEKEVAWLSSKIANLRIFQDGSGKMNHSLLDIGAEVLVVSQFTLFGDCRKGRRPNFTSAARPEVAEPLYLAFCSHLEGLGISVQKGVFGASMEVRLCNDGPVTLVLDTAHTPR
jgi:D-aminoacyl-tRNA deacylase